TKRLASLNLRFISRKAESLPPLVEALHYMPQLRWLDFSGVLLSGDDVTSFAAAVPYIPQLKDLDISSCTLTDAAIVALAEALQVGVAAGLQLEYFVAKLNRDSRIGPTGAAAFAAAFKAGAGKALRHLNLQGVRLRDDGIVAL